MNSNEVRTVWGLLERAVAATPDKPAVLSPDGTTSYSELRERALRLGGGLRAAGLDAGAPVVVMLDNHVDHIATAFGLAAVGLVDVPLNTALKGGMLEYQIAHSEATVVVCDTQYVERIAAVLSNCPRVAQVVVRGQADGTVLPDGVARSAFADLLKASPAVPVAAEAWDLAAIMYTSGTTGPSKGVLCPNGQAVAYGDPGWWGGCGPDDVHLVTLPLFHLGGMWMGVFNAVSAGATIALPEKFSASVFWQEVREYGATYAVLVGAITNILMRQPSRPDDADNTLARAFVVPVVDGAREFEQRFGCLVGTGFGQTEATGALGAKFGEGKPKSCGWARPGIEARIVDDRDREVADGTAGELVLRADEPWMLSLGYHGMPEATVSLYRNQWLHTGDTMYRSADGEFFFVDRKSDAIRRRGENVSSFEVEAEVNRHPAVLESAAVGVVSELSEEDIKIVVVLQPGKTLQPDDLIRYLADRLPYYMVPRYVTFIDALPRSATDKIQKAELRASAATAAWDAVAHGLHVGRSGIREGD